MLFRSGSGAAGFLKETGSGAVGLLKDIGSGIKNLGEGSLQTRGSTTGTITGYNSGAPVAAGSGFGPLQVGGQSVGQIQPIGQTTTSGALSQVSARNFGDMNSPAPVDNYSYYGALQSKGGDYMPVTADFSSFRK